MLCIFLSWGFLFYIKNVKGSIMEFNKYDDDNVDALLCFSGVLFFGCKVAKDLHIICVCMCVCVLAIITCQLFGSTQQ